MCSYPTYLGRGRFSGGVNVKGWSCPLQYMSWHRLFCDVLKLEGFQISFQVMNSYSKNLWRVFLFGKRIFKQRYQDFVGKIRGSTFWWRYSFLLDLERLIEKPLPRINWPVARSKREVSAKGGLTWNFWKHCQPRILHFEYLIDMIWAETMHWRFYNIMRVSSFYFNIHVCACSPNWKTIGEMIEKQAWKLQVKIFWTPKWALILTW